MVENTRVRGSSRRNKAPASGTILPEPFRPCPFRTPNRQLPKEAEVRAYKLGKRRWSYNQCELRLIHQVTGEEAEVVDCMQYGTSPLTEREQESGVNFQVRLQNGFRVQLNVFAVYNNPREVKNEDGEIEYEWPCITRNACPRAHCEGPVLRTIQRFGKLGRRSGQNAAEANARDSDNGMKNAKYMFISLDEAGSHVKVKHFRMITGLYSAGNPECLGTAISPPIRVLANNDVPTGAAFIQYVLHPSPSWNGWHAVNTYQARLPDSIRLRTLATESHSHSSNETDYGHQEGYAKPSLPAVLLQHAKDWSKDADHGAERFNSALNLLGYDSATSPTRALRLPSFLGPEEEVAPFNMMQDSPSLPCLHNSSIQSSTLNYNPMSSALVDYSPDLPPSLPAPDAAASPLPLTLPGLGPSGLSSMPYITLPNFPGPMYNPFQMQGLADRDPGNWISDELLECDR